MYVDVVTYLRTWSRWLCKQSRVGVGIRNKPDVYNLSEPDFLRVNPIYFCHYMSLSVSNDKIPSLWCKSWVFCVFMRNPLAYIWIFEVESAHCWNLEYAKCALFSILWYRNCDSLIQSLCCPLMVLKKPSRWRYLCLSKQ